MYKNLPGELGEGVRVALYVIKCFTSKNQYGSTFFPNAIKNGVIKEWRKGYDLYKTLLEV